MEFIDEKSVLGDLRLESLIYVSNAKLPSRIISRPLRTSGIKMGRNYSKWIPEIDVEREKFIAAVRQEREPHRKFDLARGPI